MGPIAELADQELVWQQPAARRRQHELKAGDEVVGTLDFQRGTLATATAADGSWTFKRQGFWHPRVTARIAGSEEDIALFRPHWSGGGQLDLRDGGTYRLASANLWQSQWVWLPETSDQPLVRFKGRPGLIKASAAVAITSEAAQSPAVPLLVLLGWYLILLYAEDAAVASTAAIVPAISS